MLQSPSRDCGVGDHVSMGLLLLRRSLLPFVFLVLFFFVVVAVAFAALCCLLSLFLFASCHDELPVVIVMFFLHVVRHDDIFGDCMNVHRTNAARAASRQPSP